MDADRKMTDAEEVLSEFQQTQGSATTESTPEPVSESKPEPVSEPEPISEPEPAPEHVSEPVSEPEPKPEPVSETTPEPEPESKVQPGQFREPAKSWGDTSRERTIIYVGKKPIMAYVQATLTQLASNQKVTIKARGRRITQAVDISQMITKRMNMVGHHISNIRILSDATTSQDGKRRNISIIEIDITKK